MAERSIDAVIFDLGGVLAANGRQSDFSKRLPDADATKILRIVMGDYGTDSDHPWHRLERGEITLEEHRRLNRAAFEEAGIELPPAQPPPSDGGPAMVFEPNGPVVALVHELRAVGMRLGVLTNNIAEFKAGWRTMLPFDELFDDVVDSHEVGMRKPNPAIYQLALARLGAEAGRTAFLDDVASNVAAARGVGMVGVVVDEDPTEAVLAVRRLAGLG
ncbi:MAG: HAD family phosphatase [Actinomycetota bacterium]